MTAKGGPRLWHGSFGVIDYLFERAVVRNPNRAPANVLRQRGKSEGNNPCPIVWVSFLPQSQVERAPVWLPRSPPLSSDQWCGGAASLVRRRQRAHSPTPTVDTDFKSTNQSFERNAMH